MTSFLRDGAVPALVCSLICCALTACGSDETAQPEAPARPVKTLTVQGGSTAALRRFPGRIEAAQRAELGFRVPGSVQEILVKEGDAVQRGALLARLDPTDFEIVVADRQATFENAERNFRRASELVKDGNISKIEFDRMEAAYKTAQAALEAAHQDLEYTRLTAPFAGRVAQRHVENFEDVVAKQVVFTLTDIDRLEVKMDLPETVLRSMRRDGDNPATAAEAGEMVGAHAEFEGVAGRRFDLSLSEVATRADPQTQTFDLTFSMAAPRDVVILPGMTATVILDLSRVAPVEESVWLPGTAVVGDAALDPRVWLLDPEAMTVSARPVTVGRMEGETIEVTSGLAPGDEIVTVGAAYLSEGQRVTRMPSSEQAEPRPGDPR